jgi:GTP cyclohydrolase II
MKLTSQVAGLAPSRSVVRYSESPLPTRRGPARLVVFREVVRGVPDPNREHVAMIVGDPGAGTTPVLVRAHSECLTSEIFGSLKCDCREQLEGAMDRMHEAGEGVLLYLRQEGRGIGLGNKIRAYALQAKGADTIQANHQLGFDTDLRNFDVAADMLLDLGIHRVELMTNNPEKIQAMRDAGIEVTRRVPIEIAANLHSERYLLTKRDKLGHLLLVDDASDPAAR